MAEQPDYYEILQVHPAAEPEVVQAAYRRLAQKYHPDVYNGQDAQQRMGMLNQAYAVLGDAQKRASYDRQRFGAGSAPHHATPGKSGPSLQVSPLTLDLGIVPLGRARTATLRVRNGGLGQLSGMVISHVAWLHVSPVDFVGNDQDIVLRFLPATLGEFKSPKAIEIYSNGGRVSVGVRGRVEGSEGIQTAPTPDGAQKFTGFPASRQVSRGLAPLRAVKVPFMGWVALLTMLTTGICFLISPYLVTVPAGLGIWMTWEHFVAKKKLLAGQPQRAASSKAQRAMPKLARCLSCGASMNPLETSKCARCGGSICPSCGACACGSANPGRSARR